MSDRETVINHFVDAIEAAGDGNKWRFVRVDILEDAIALLKAQEPRLLTLDEVTKIGRRESGRTSGEDVNPVWLEETTTLLGKTVKTLYMVLLSKPFDFPDAGEEMFYAKYFGTDLDDALRPEKYGKRWRCWSAKPSKEQREAVKWDAAD